VPPGTLIYTDEYTIYARLTEWGYDHKTVNHADGEYARDEDGDGFHEVHVNTLEGFWSLLRSWLRPHRGISQEKLPLYLAFCSGQQHVAVKKCRIFAHLHCILGKLTITAHYMWCPRNLSNCNMLLTSTKFWNKQPKPPNNGFQQTPRARFYIDVAL
jgi:transposase-like protein